MRLIDVDEMLSMMSEYDLLTKEDIEEYVETFGFYEVKKSGKLKLIEKVEVE